MCRDLHLAASRVPAADRLTRAISITYIGRFHWLAGCSFVACLPARGQDRGDVLTTLFTNAAITTATPIDAPVRRKRYSWLPLLTVLFCLSYGLMTMLIVEQGATIESQRALIRELFRDSTELTSFKMKAQQEKILAGAQASPSPKAQAPVTRGPSIQVPSTQAPTQHAPSSQAAQQHSTQRQNPQYQMPSRPAADLGDNRRALITI